MLIARLRTVGVTGVAAVLLGGCGGSVKGTPVAELWDPCSIPSNALVGAGIDPAPLGSDKNPASTAAEAAFCTYATDSFDLTVYSFRAPMDARSTPEEAREEIEVGGRGAIRFDRPITPTWVSCIVGIDARSSSVELEARPDIVTPSNEDPCSVATKLTELLLPHLPR
ncbi:DUF3558 family protein [Rhodococcus kroppenstedtii]|uniref:DUF3558 family protein n=1 Tax=Rhodococcoides kroppenstedtii TaxID=293050 RepID=UPI002954175E|nr:DUF3558 family protein [Rhodococcus kroppenstedtii]MDV7195993.1 DUF3558 family protein [Rhodococcus kroppenstedtii]